MEAAECPAHPRRAWASGPLRPETKTPSKLVEGIFPCFRHIFSIHSMRPMLRQSNCNVYCIFNGSAIPDSLDCHAPSGPLLPQQGIQGNRHRPDSSSPPEFPMPPEANTPSPSLLKPASLQYPIGVSRHSPFESVLSPDATGVLRKLVSHSIPITNANNPSVATSVRPWAKSPSCDFMMYLLVSLSAMTTI